MILAQSISVIQQIELRDQWEPSDHSEGREVRGRSMGSKTAEAPRAHKSGDNGLAAHQTQLDTATETLRFFGQNGECAARHKMSGR
jgi:hypothetical protein